MAAKRQPRRRPLRLWLLIPVLALALWEGGLRLTYELTPGGAVPAATRGAVPEGTVPGGAVPGGTVPVDASSAAQPASRWRYVPIARDEKIGPSVTAAAAILVEPTTMTVLYARREHQPRPPASTTKILTALLALERGRLDDVVTVSRRAAAVPGSTIHLRAGQKISLSDLIVGLLMRSGNDAATAIAEHVAGTEAAFVHWMNRRARELGATNSRFANPHGLDAPNHYTTAFDLAHLARLAMTMPTFKDVVGRREYVPPGSGRSWRNTNRLLWALEGTEGIKTGTTGGAGNCLVAAVSRDGVRLIAVVLGSRDRWLDTRRLIEWGFAAFHMVTGAAAGQSVVEARVPGGIGSLQATPATDLTFMAHEDELRQVRIEAALDPAMAPIAKGARVGHVRAVVGDEVRREVPLLALKAVPRWTPLRALKGWLVSGWTSLTGK